VLNSLDVRLHYNFFRYPYSCLCPISFEQVVKKGAKLPASQKNVETFLTRAQLSIRLGPPAPLIVPLMFYWVRRAGDLEISIRVSSSRLRERRCLAHCASGWKESRVNFLLKVFPRKWHTKIS